MSRPRRKSSPASGTLIQVAYKFKAYPTDLQCYRMENWMGSLCHLANESMSERKDAHRFTGRGLTAISRTPCRARGSKTRPLAAVHSQVWQDALRRVDKTCQKFFDDIQKKKAGQKIKVGYLRVERFDQYKSFTFPQVWMTVTNKKTGNLQKRRNAK